MAEKMLAYAIDPHQLPAKLSEIGIDPGAFCEIKTFSDAVYYQYKDFGVSFCFDCKEGTTGPLAAIHIYNAGNNYGFTPIKRSDLILPCGIGLNSTIRDIIRLFAPEEPVKGGGSRTGMRIWINYPHHHLSLEFDSYNWDDPNALWTEITLTCPNS
jgi:hypothetical protein